MTFTSDFDKVNKVIKERELPGMFSKVAGTVEICNSPQPFPEDVYVEEEDVMLTDSQMEGLLYNDYILNRKASSNLASYWPDSGGFPYIPFAYLDGFVDRSKVWAAMQEWESATCLNFEEVPSTYSGAHLQFQIHEVNCSSYVGVTSSSGQPIYITKVCQRDKGSLLVELGHAIGLWHEETRSDRDSYVHINADNVLPEKKHNFFKESDNSYGVPYDYSSIMHSYERIYQLNGHMTIATYNPLYQGLIGQSSSLSHMDKLLVNQMYGCSAKLIAAGTCTSDPCLNNGYLAKDCSCVCPDGTSGTNCETVTTPYNGKALLSPYTEEITSPTTITTPNYPSKYPAGLKFTKWIKAPECSQVVATFTAFDTYMRTPHYIREEETVDMCWYDGLEIRTDNMLDGTWYCGTEISSGDTFTSVQNEMILFFKSSSSFKTGWSADITFVEKENCATSPTSTTTSSSTTPTSTTTSSSTTPTSTTTSSSTTPTSTTTSSSTTPTSTTTSSSTTTSTSTSSSSTSSISSSTSTTSTTTSSTSSSTSTTSTSTATSTSSTTSTTTTTPLPTCTTYYSNGYNYLESPKYPAIYPHNSQCTEGAFTVGQSLLFYKQLSVFDDLFNTLLKFSSTQTSLVDTLLYINAFRLGSGDSVTVYNQYTPPLTLHGDGFGPMSGAVNDCKQGFYQGVVIQSQVNGGQCVSRVGIGNGIPFPRDMLKCTVVFTHGGEVSALMGGPGVGLSSKGVHQGSSKSGAIVAKLKQMSISKWLEWSLVGAGAKGGFVGTSSCQ
ncbi:protein SpAN-like [Palaemon carinicauda]|uniref:protein SpAN-like n=1 Tax=Palaemon carinicauda TaxID=392227 RepID=UPI0035B627A8